MTGLATILGATGFVGRRLQARLTAEGWDVFAPAKGDKSLFGRDMGVVFYCAGLTADYDRRPFETVEAHASLVSELIQAGRFEQIIYLSSTRLYDGQAAEALDETAPLLFDPADPRRVYDLSKALGENLIAQNFDGFQHAFELFHGEHGHHRTTVPGDEDRFLLDRFGKVQEGLPGIGDGQRVHGRPRLGPKCTSFGAFGKGRLASAPGHWKRLREALSSRAGDTAERLRRRWSQAGQANPQVHPWTGGRLARWQEPNPPA